MNKILYPFLAILLLLYPVKGYADTVSLSPTYDYTVFDSVTGSNFISDSGWYVDPGADEHQNDFIRERPLGTQDFSQVNGNWVHPGKYYAYLDIVKAEWGYDNDYLYFKQTLYGNWDMDDAADARDYGVFGSGTFYNIIIGQGDTNVYDGDEANYSILLRSDGAEKSTWTNAPAGNFDSKATQGWWDANGDVSDNGISLTKEDGDTVGNGYDYQAILTDGYFDTGNGNPYLLYARVTGAETIDDSQPYVEIALNYAIWNNYADSLGLPLIDPALIPFIVFETNRGTQDNQNYLWNDTWTHCEEGSPYNLSIPGCDPIIQLGSVYELDRVYWTGENGVEPIPEPATMLLLGTGLVGVAGAARRKKKNQA